MSMMCRPPPREESRRGRRESESVDASKRSSALKGSNKLKMRRSVRAVVFRDPFTTYLEDNGPVAFLLFYLLTYIIYVSGKKDIGANKLKWKKRTAD
jgi:hypothetical protein